jgi:hypothetical protein
MSPHNLSIIFFIHKIKLLSGKLLNSISQLCEIAFRWGMTKAKRRKKVSYKFLLYHCTVWMFRILKGGMRVWSSMFSKYYGVYTTRVHVNMTSETVNGQKVNNFVNWYQYDSISQYCISWCKRRCDLQTLQRKVLFLLSLSRSLHVLVGYVINPNGIILPSPELRT